MLQRLLVVLVCLGCCVVSSGCRLVEAVTGPSATAPSPEARFRGVWVTRWDYRTAEDVRRIIDDLSIIGVTDVFWQVRGQADAFYESPLEPWGELLLEGLPEGATTPGFDPLALAIAEAHRRSMRVHAWVNVMPLWRGTTPPKDPRHIFRARSSWRMHDASGRPQPLEEGYVIVNPVHEEVHDHIVAVCRDILTRYAVDGLHLDYIRFVPPSDRAMHPADAWTVSQFERATGRVGLDAPGHREAFRAWIGDRITALVRRIRREAVSVRPGVEFSAALWRRPDLGRETYLQDGVRWLREGLIDRGLPMIYTENDQQFREDWDAWRASAPGARLTPGLGLYRHPPGQTAMQVGLAPGASGFALFAYSSMFESADRFQDKSPAQVSLRQNRRQAVMALIRRFDEAERSEADRRASAP